MADLHALMRDAKFDEIVTLLEPVAIAGSIGAQDAAALGLAYSGLGRHAAAVAVYGPLARALETNADVWLSLGNALCELGDMAEAREAYGRAVTLAPQSPVALSALALAISSVPTPKNYADAISLLERALNYRPDWAIMWYHLGALRNSNGELAAAEAALRRAVELEPRAAEAWYQLYFSLVETGHEDRALAALERCVALDPDYLTASDELDRLRASRSASRRKLVRFPKDISEFVRLDAAIERLIVPETGDAAPFLTKRAKVLTTGSCFARNISLGLRALGVSAEHVEHVEDMNNTYANRLFFEWVSGEPTAQDAVFDQIFGAEYRANIAALLASADAVVYSLGVAPVFFDNSTGEPVLPLGHSQNLALQNESTTFRTTSVAENVANMRRMEELLRRVNPKATFVITVSPVPLRATLEYKTAMAADCVSKSTLRVAADEFIRSSDGPAVYWPSFEVVRWFGSHYGVMFGDDDGSAFHVNQPVVDAILRAFIKRFGDDELRAAL